MNTVNERMIAAREQLRKSMDDFERELNLMVAIGTAFRERTGIVLHPAQQFLDADLARAEEIVHAGSVAVQ